MLSQIFCVSFRMRNDDVIIRKGRACRENGLSLIAYFRYTLHSMLGGMVYCSLHHHYHRSDCSPVLHHIIES